MKKTLPYLTIIAIIYLSIAFILNEINFTKWEDQSRASVVILSALICGFYSLKPSEL
jgi:hypothetical protein